jgi:hypothetical protein
MVHRGPDDETVWSMVGKGLSDDDLAALKSFAK